MFQIKLHQKYVLREALCVYFPTRPFEIFTQELKLEYKRLRRGKWKCDEMARETRHTRKHSNDILTQVYSLFLFLFHLFL